MRYLFWPAAFLLNKIEQFCQWFQKLTGLTCYWWFGKAALAVVFTTFAGWLRAKYGLPVIWWTMYGQKGMYGVFLLGMVIGFYGYDAVRGWKTLEEMAFERLSEGIANSAKVWGLPVMMFVLLTCWLNAFQMSLMLYAFLRACDPLPPCRGKVQEWWANRHKQLIPISVKEKRCL
jgi:hypothetical protein